MTRSSRGPELELLRRRLGSSSRIPERRAVSATGIPQLDEQLPEGGVAASGLIEIFCEPRSSSGAWRLAALMIAHATRRRMVALLESSQQKTRLFAPALSALGVSLERLLSVRPEPHRLPWALEELARSADLELVVATASRLSQRQLRRLQLATEESLTRLILMRSNHDLPSSAPSCLRLYLEPLRPDSPGLRRGFRLEALRCRGANLPPDLSFEVEDATGALPLPAPLPDRALGSKP